MQILSAKLNRLQDHAVPVSLFLLILLIINLILFHSRMPIHVNWQHDHQYTSIQIFFFKSTKRLIMVKSSVLET